MVSKRRKPFVEQLEQRRLLTGVNEGQLFLYLLNEARHDPAAYAASETLPINFLDVEPRQPLAVNANLQQAAQFHSVEMAENDYFAHQSAVTGQWPNANARAHGYNLPSWWESDNNFIESIAAGTITATPKAALRQLMLSPSHRDHLLGISDFNAQNTEGGVGYAFAADSTYNNYWTAQLARTEPSQVFLTGVVYDDLNDNGRYDLKEGIAGINVSNGVSNVLTNAAGGWSLQVSTNESYQIVVGASGGPLAANVAVSGENRHVEFRTDFRMSRTDFSNWIVSSDRTLPTASLAATNLRIRHQPTHAFTVTYQDNVAIDGSTIATGNIIVNGPAGYQQVAELVSKTQVGAQWNAVYRVSAPNSTWSSVDNGTYSVQLLANQVRDTGDNAVAPATLGNFQVNISSVIRPEDVNDDGLVSPLDIVILVNYLNSVVTSENPPAFRPELDVSVDGRISPLDIILIINFLNQALAGAGETESVGRQVSESRVSFSEAIVEGSAEVMNAEEFMIDWEDMLEDASIRRRR